MKSNKNTKLEPGAFPGEGESGDLAPGENQHFSRTFHLLKMREGGGNNTISVTGKLAKKILDKSLLHHFLVYKERFFRFAIS